MSEPLFTSNTPLSDGWGLRLDYDFMGMLSTSLTEGGYWHQPGIAFTVNPDLGDRYVFKLAAPFGTTEGKILPDTDVPGTYTDNFHWGILVGMGHETRLSPFFRSNGQMWGSLFSLTIPMIGGGSFSSQQPDRTVGGSDFSFEEHSVTTLDMSTQYGFGIEFMPAGRFPLIRVAPTLSMGLLYAPSDSQWNRMTLSLGFTASIGYGDASIAEDSADYDTHAMGIAYETYAKLHAILQTIFMNQVLADKSEQLGDYGLYFGGEDPGGTEDIRVLEGASAFFGAMGIAGSREYFLTLGDLNPLPLALEGVGGIAIMAATRNNSGMGTGLGNLLNAAGMATYMFMGVDEPSERYAMGSDMLPRLMGSALISYGINLLAFGIGAIVADSDSGGDAGWVLMSSGAQANFGVAFSPDPTESGGVDRSTFAYIPVTYYSQGDVSGCRSGVLISRSFTDWPVYTEARFLTHALRLDNVFKRMGTEPSEQYGDAGLPSEVAATLGVHYDHRWFWVGAGLDTTILYGSGDGAAAGIGVSGGAGLQIPFNGQDDGSGLALGVRASVHYLLPAGWDAEVSPYLGALVHF